MHIVDYTYNIRLLYKNYYYYYKKKKKSLDFGNIKEVSSHFPESSALFFFWNNFQIISFECPLSFLISTADFEKAEANPGL